MAPKKAKKSSSSPTKTVKWDAACRRAWVVLKSDNRFRGLVVSEYTKQPPNHKYARGESFFPGATCASADRATVVPCRDTWKKVQMFFEDHVKLMLDINAVKTWFHKYDITSARRASR